MQNWLTGFNRDEREVMIHALSEARDRIMNAGGNQYGHFSIKQVESLIQRLGGIVHKYQTHREEPDLKQTAVMPPMAVPH